MLPNKENSSPRACRDASVCKLLPMKAWTPKFNPHCPCKKQLLFGKAEKRHFQEPAGQPLEIISELLDHSGFMQLSFGVLPLKIRGSHWGRLQHETLAHEHTKTAYSFLNSLLSNVEAFFIVRFVTHEIFRSSLRALPILLSLRVIPIKPQCSWVGKGMEAKPIHGRF